MSAYQGERQRLNEESLAGADHYRESWTSTQLELLALWDGTEKELSDLAELLGRTREACRQMFYVQRSVGTEAVLARRSRSRAPRVSKEEAGDSSPTSPVRTVSCPHCGLVHPGEC